MLLTIHSRVWSFWLTFIIAPPMEVPQMSKFYRNFLTKDLSCTGYIWFWGILSCWPFQTIGHRKYSSKIDGIHYIFWSSLPPLFKFCKPSKFRMTLQSCVYLQCGINISLIDNIRPVVVQYLHSTEHICNVLTPKFIPQGHWEVHFVQ